jgi:four helix bundle protein
MQSYKDLEIYNLSHQLAVEVHKLSLTLPSFERFEEGNQIRRSSKAIPANIVEGFGRRKYQQDYCKFLVYAHASCNETIEHLELLFETESLSNKDVFEDLFNRYNTLGRKINWFIRAFGES